MRKGTIAAACKYLDALDGAWFGGLDAKRRIGYAIGVICRAAKVETTSFNRIGRERLRGLTAMFNKMARDMDGVIEEGFRTLTLQEPGESGELPIQ